MAGLNRNSTEVKQVRVRQVGLSDIRSGPEKQVSNYPLIVVLQGNPKSRRRFSPRQLRGDSSIPVSNFSSLEVVE